MSLAIVMPQLRCVNMVYLSPRYVVTFSELKDAIV